MPSEELINSVPLQFQDARYHAHIKEMDIGIQSETLLEHSMLTIKYFDLFGDKKGIKRVINGLISELGFTEAEADLVYLAFVYAIFLHDFGKINPRYQYDVLGNKSFRNMRNQANNSYHALASAYLYLDFVCQLLPQPISPRLSKCLVAFAFGISKHHGSLGDGHEFTELDCFDEAYCKSELENDTFHNARFYMQQHRLFNNPTAFFILCRLLYALIVSCDYCATQEFMTGSPVEVAVISTGGADLLDVYNHSPICQSIRRCQQHPGTDPEIPINSLRSQMFLEAESNLLANIDSHLYCLEAPTGAGKTNMSINLTLKLVQMDETINNIFYVFPFNTLVEQTKATMLPFFGDKMAVINSITPVTIGGDGRVENYDAAWLDHIFNNYPIVLTSHINFFNALFGCGRSQCFPLLKLCNSVVVLDEIQSYKNSIWREIISFLQQYAKLLNMRIIIMSATLPQLDNLLRTVDVKITGLIGAPRRYYEHPLFRHRVRLDFSLLSEGKISLDRLKQEVLRFIDKRVLVEFIKKKTAREFYLLCKDECNAVLLTGDDNAARREEIIQRIHRGERLILIATQVIEAGIDIDMEIGFKDISLLDAEEQFLGRINRSCLNQAGAVAYFFNYDEAKDVYRGDARLNYSILDPIIRELLVKKDFSKYYAYVFEDLIARTSKSNNINILNLDKHCAQFNCKTIESQMRLIEPNLQMFVPYICHDLNGYEVWNEYKELGSNNTISYTRRMIEYSRIALKMSYFTFQVYKDKVPPGVEQYGGYYFIDGGERFVDEGVLDRAALEEYYGGKFL